MTKNRFEAFTEDEVDVIGLHLYQNIKFLYAGYTDEDEKMRDELIKEIDRYIEGVEDDK